MLTPDAAAAAAVRLHLIWFDELEEEVEEVVEDGDRAEDERSGDEEAAVVELLLPPHEVTGPPAPVGRLGEPAPLLREEEEEEEEEGDEDVEDERMELLLRTFLCGFLQEDLPASLFTLPASLGKTVETEVFISQSDPE